MKQAKIETRRYYAPQGGLPAQTELHTGRAVFTEAYAVIPRGVYSDIVTSYLPHWEATRLWIIARPSNDRPKCRFDIGSVRSNNVDALRGSHQFQCMHIRTHRNAPGYQRGEPSSATTK